MPKLEEVLDNLKSTPFHAESLSEAIIVSFGKIILRPILYAILKSYYLVKLPIKRTEDLYLFGLNLDLKNDTLLEAASLGPSAIGGATLGIVVSPMLFAYNIFTKDKETLRDELRMCETVLELHKNEYVSNLGYKQAERRKVQQIN